MNLTRRWAPPRRRPLWVGGVVLATVALTVGGVLVLGSNGSAHSADRVGPLSNPLALPRSWATATVPELQGMTRVGAAVALSAAQLEMSATGSGRVVTQFPPAGEHLADGAVVDVVLAGAVGHGGGPGGAGGGAGSGAGGRGSGAGSSLPPGGITPPSGWKPPTGSSGGPPPPGPVPSGSPTVEAATVDITYGPGSYAGVVSAEWLLETPTGEVVATATTTDGCQVMRAQLPGPVAGTSDLELVLERNVGAYGSSVWHTLLSFAFPALQAVGAADFELSFSGNGAGPVPGGTVSLTTSDTGCS